MHEKRGNGPNLRPLLLIPAIFMVSKAMHRHRRMGAHRWGYGPGATGRPGHHGWAGSTDPESGPGFRLPPKIEAFLDAWHTQAHEAAGSTETTADAGEAPTT